MSNTEGILAELASLRDRAENAQPALEAVADDWLLLQEDLFASAGAPVGGWAPHSPGYAARKTRGSMLVDEGDLAASLTTGAHGASIRRVSDEEVVVGTSRPTATLHQQGTSSMPARPVQPPQQLLEQRWIPLIEAYMAGDEPESLGL